VVVRIVITCIISSCVIGSCGIIISSVTIISNHTILLTGLGMRTWYGEEHGTLMWSLQGRHGEGVVGK